MGLEEIQLARVPRAGRRPTATERAAHEATGHAVFKEPAIRAIKSAANEVPKEEEVVPREIPKEECESSGEAEVAIR